MPVQIRMPSVAAGLNTATLARWLKRAGDHVTEGEVLAEIETDKTTVEVEAVAEGTIGRLFVAEGADFSVSEPLAYIFGSDEPLQEDPESPTLCPGDATNHTPLISAEIRPQRRYASPLARRVAIQLGIDLAAVSGSGPGGRIVKIDVIRASELAIKYSSRSTDSDPFPHMVSTSHLGADQGEHIAVTAKRSAAARGMQEAKRNIPHFYLRAECVVDRTLSLLEDLKGRVERAQNLSIDAFIVKAAAVAMYRVPESNRIWTDHAMVALNSVDVSVSVVVDDGLATPILRSVDQKGLRQISDEILRLAERAQSGSLSHSEYEGGSITISNLGAYGVREFSPIIKPGQTTSLAIGTIERRPVVADGEIGVASVMACTLSVDHRVLDGAVAARLLAAFKTCIEDPIAMLADC